MSRADWFALATLVVFLTVVPAATKYPEAKNALLAVVFAMDAALAVIVWHEGRDLRNRR